MSRSNKKKKKHPPHQSGQAQPDVGQLQAPGTDENHPEQGSPDQIKGKDLSATSAAGATQVQTRIENQADANLGTREKPATAGQTEAEAEAHASPQIQIQTQASPALPPKPLDMKRLPTIDDLRQALEQARRELDKPVHLTWQLKPMGHHYVLSVTCTADGPPTWLFDMGMQRPVWKFLGDDLAILLEHATKQSSGDSAEPPPAESPKFPTLPPVDSRSLAAFPFGVKQGANVRDSVLAHQAQQTLIDQQLVLKQQELLQEPRTKIVSSPWLLYFLDQEFFRQTSCGVPFAIVLISLRLREPGETNVLPVSTIRDVARCVSTAIRRIDLFAHYGDNDYALLLPHTDLAAAAVVANRISTLLANWHSGLKVSQGIASIPEDANDPNILLATAQQALHYAEARDIPVVTFKSLVAGSNKP